MKICCKNDLLGRRFDHINLEEVGDAISMGKAMTGDMRRRGEGWVVGIDLQHFVHHVRDIGCQGSGSFKEFHGKGREGRRVKERQGKRT